MKIEVELPGDFDEQLVQALIKVEGVLNKDVKNIVNQALLAIESRAKDKSPVDTGRLRSSIHAVGIGLSDNYRYSIQASDGQPAATYDGALTDADGTDEGIGYVGTNVEYAPEQEFGGNSGNKGGHKFLTLATAEIIPKMNIELSRLDVKP